MSSSSIAERPYLPAASGDSFLFHFRRPFFDLGPLGGEAPLNSHGPLVAYAALESGSENGIERIPAEGFRWSLLSQSGLRQYARLAPAQVPKELRTARWQHLCEQVEGFAGLAPAQQAGVVRLLITLGFLRLVLQLVPSSGLDLRDSEQSRVAANRAFTRYFLHLEQLGQYQPTDLEEVARLAPERSMARHFTAKLLLIHAAKVQKDLERARHYRQAAQALVEDPSHDRGSFEYHMWVSRFYRAASFIPFLQGDKARVVAELDLSEELGRKAIARTPQEAVIQKDVLVSMLETRMREALWLRELELAQARIAEATQIDPWDPKARMELAEMYLRRERLEEAAREYQRAARLGPPGTPLAHYMAGHCHERLGDPERATDCYNESLRADPQGISPLMGLLRTARRTGQTPLYRWAESRAEELIREGHLTREELREQEG